MSTVSINVEVVAKLIIRCVQTTHMSEESKQRMVEGFLKDAFDAGKMAAPPTRPTSTINEGQL